MIISIGHVNVGLTQGIWNNISMIFRINQQPFVSKFIWTLTVFILISSICQSKNNTISTGSANLQGAAWIGDPQMMPVVDSLFYEEHPAPLFRKEFSIKQKIKRVILYITAAGYYQASLNGEKIGNNYLDPAWTNYSKRIYYSEYDITSNIRQGNNCIGVTLGNGFYNPLPMQLWGYLNLRIFLPTGIPVFIAKTKIEYVDGKTEEILTWANCYDFF